MNAFENKQNMKSISLSKNSSPLKKKKNYWNNRGKNIKQRKKLKKDSFVTMLVPNFCKTFTNVPILACLTRINMLMIMKMISILNMSKHW